MKKIIKMGIVSSLLAAHLNAVTPVENLEIIPAPVVVKKETSVLSSITQGTTTLAWTAGTILLALGAYSTRSDGSWGVENSDAHKTAKIRALNTLSVVGGIILAGNVVLNAIKTFKKIQSYRKAPVAVVEVSDIQ